MSNIIQKKIHYCWFGGNPLPELAEKCINSWKEHCPDYEIIEWNENNFDVTCCDYVREAYEAKKWAFVSDYARFKILYENGGVYLDTDVELLKSLDDLLEKGSFMGCENYTTDEMKVAPGLGCATEPGNEFYLELMKNYENSHFLNSDGSQNLYNVVVRTTDLLKKHGLKSSFEIQNICGITIYPAEYLCPIDQRDGSLNITNNTYSIHHYMASWFSPKIKVYSKFIKFLYRCLGENGFEFLRKILGRKSD